MTTNGTSAATGTTTTISIIIIILLLINNNKNNRNRNRNERNKNNRSNQTIREEIDMVALRAAVDNLSFVVCYFVIRQIYFVLLVSGKFNTYLITIIKYKKCR